MYPLTISFINNEFVYRALNFHEEVTENAVL
jgi:hypothetical protein